MAKRWFLLTIAAVFSLCPTCAFALKVIEVDGAYIYFPKEAGALAQRIASWYCPMASFLQEQGIPISEPLHIVLDHSLDQPEALTRLYPHREIRLPMRAPGAFEDGYTEADPWRYFLFKGLCELGIYGERSGLPSGLHLFFGEVISPNLILPDWTIDGYSHLLYEVYSFHRVEDPLAEAVLYSGAIPSLDRVSHHPEIWPGQFSYRIYGRPFIRWLYQRFGWERMLLFLQLHGRGIVPIEIDLKANRAFGLSWNQLWRIFQMEHPPIFTDRRGISIVGHWDAPYLYWNETGVHPGVKQSGTRSRYGYVDEQHRLWISQYIKGISKIKLHSRGTVHNVVQDHLWDPGPGSVAVTRHGYTPALILFGPPKGPHLMDGLDDALPIKGEIEGPVGALQMSGPVMDRRGRIAVAANIAGNWEIWLYDKRWYRVTHSPTIEVDPWFIDDKLIFASNVSGKFQIHSSDMAQLTHAPTATLLPRNNAYLELDATGWQRKTIDRGKIPLMSETLPQDPMPPRQNVPETSEGKDYAAGKSLWTNYIAPDYFFNIDNFQIGLSTNAADVSRAYTWNAGIRYDIDEGQMTWRLGYHAKTLSTRATQYPLRYFPQRGPSVDEKRIEVNVSWSPPTLKELTMSANWRHYTRNLERDMSDDDRWVSLGWKDGVGSIHAALNLDLFKDDSQSLYGELLYRYGEKVSTIIRIQGGKTWGDLNPGHNTFRIGGNSGEGYFTQRYSRLFSLRGFDGNILEAGQAASASLNVLWPFARLQTGYKTMPLFLHNITVNTFIDSGFAANQFDEDQILVSAGIELITGMQLAWDNKSNFRIGLAWPLTKPSDIEQEGPVLLILIGRPL